MPDVEFEVEIEQVSEKTKNKKGEPTVTKYKAKGAPVYPETTPAEKVTISTEEKQLFEVGDVVTVTTKSRQGSLSEVEG